MHTKTHDWIPSPAQRLAFAILAFCALGGAGNPAGQVANPASRATAQASVRIRQPVILQAGKATQRSQAPILPARERRCATGDAPANTECRLIVTDFE